MQVSSSELERLQAIKHSMNRLLNRVGKVKQELEHILDDDADMLVLRCSSAMTARRGSGLGLEIGQGQDWR